MPSYQCPNCQTVHSLGAVPEEKLGYLIPDDATEDLVDRIEEEDTEDEEQRLTNIDFLITQAGHEVYRCTECGTLVIGGKSPWSGVYRPINR